MEIKMNTTQAARKPELKVVGKMPSMDAAQSTIRTVTKPRARLTTEDHDRIMEVEPRMIRIAKKLVRGWGAPVALDEVESIARLALCDAARRYNPDYGVCFSTYAFHFVRGDLIKSIRCLTQIAHNEQAMEEISVRHEDEPHHQALDHMAAPEEVSSPCLAFERAELGKAIDASMAALDPLSREIFLEIHLYGEKVTTVAKKLDYSRGHTSELRRAAREKLQTWMGDWQPPRLAA
jgi:RNA polymerase sigma factor (sigma-70 family)